MNEIDVERLTIRVKLFSPNEEPYIDFLKRHGCQLSVDFHRYFDVTLPPGSTRVDYHPPTSLASESYFRVTFPDGTSIIERQMNEPGRARYGYLYGNPFE